MNHLEKRLERIEAELDERDCRHDTLLAVPCPPHHRGFNWPGEELVRICQDCRTVVSMNGVLEVAATLVASPDDPQGVQP